MSLFLGIVVCLIAAKWVAQQILEALNRAAVAAAAKKGPGPALNQVMDAQTHAKSTEYTLTKSRLHQLELTWDALVLGLVLFTGVLPATLGWFQNMLGDSAWAMAAYLFCIGVVLCLPDLPWSWYFQFRIEERFGFNNSTHRLWWMDRLKALLLAVILGYPLLLLVLNLVEWTGEHWWVWVWAALLSFQLLMTVIAPVVILPLFNKLTPLPEGSLRDRLLHMAKKTEFRAQSIQMMDGSKRSRHSNAFFTGFGAFRKIVLFDTLVQQLEEAELEAVLAHEIGHYKRKHILKMLLFSAISSLIAFYLLSVLTKQDWFYKAFDFQPGNIVPALLLFTLLSGLATFWFSPVTNARSRKYEYEADAFAAQVMQEPLSLIGALRKLNKENLANLTPHPIYSTFYYSHPTLLERESALTHSNKQA